VRGKYLNPHFSGSVAEPIEPQNFSEAGGGICVAAPVNTNKILKKKPLTVQD
jgi:hypothetical protein